jgi:hypothetical protein
VYATYWPLGSVLTARIVRSVTRLAVLVLAAVALGGCGGSDAPDEDPGEFATTLVEELDHGRTAQAWDSLHPRHQEAVPRDRYVSCERRDPIDGDVTGVQVTSVHEEPWTIPGEDGDVDSTAVTLRLTLEMPDAQPDTFDLTVHLFPVDGRWTWVIGPADYRSYAGGSCPAQG